MLTSVHVAELGSVGPVWRPPKSSKVPGLARAAGGFVARLTSTTRPSLEPGRVVMVAQWESESSLASFLSTTAFGDGWTARCEPIRASGSWASAASGLTTGREPERDEPVIVVGHAKTNLTKSMNVVKFMAEASGTMMMFDSMRWGCTYVGPPYLGTVTMWRSSTAMMQAVYNTRSGFGNATAPLEDEAGPQTLENGAFGEGGHRGAMTAGAVHEFFAESGYVRLRPVHLDGSVGGRDPLDSSVFD